MMAEQRWDEEDENKRYKNDDSGIRSALLRKTSIRH